jgi:hypothetical protein
MPNRPPSARPETLHVEFGRLDTRVKFIEDSVRGIISELSGQREDSRKSSDSLRDYVQHAIVELGTNLGKRIDQQAPKGTPWLQVSGLLVAVFSVAGGFWAYSTSQNNANSARIEAMVVSESADRKGEVRDIHLEMEPIIAAVAQHANDIKRFDVLDDSIKILWQKEWPKEAQDEYEKRIDEKVAIYQHFNDRDFTDLKGRVDTVAADQIKRPELEATDKAKDDKISELGTRENILEGDVHSGWSLSDTVKSLEARIENMRAQFGTALTPAAPAPAMK